MKEHKDCLACSESFSVSATNANEGDTLYCTLKEKYVKEDDLCEDFN